MNASLLFAGLLLTCLLGRPQPSAAAEHEEGINQQRQSMGGLNENYEQSFLPQDQSRWTYPVSGTDPVLRTDRVFQAFPQDGAVYLKNMIITLGWQPADTGTITARRYEVLVYHQGGQQVILRPGESIPGKPTTVMYQAPAPGNYMWQVWAHFDDRIVASVPRTFKVIP